MRRRISRNWLLFARTRQKHSSAKKDRYSSGILEGDDEEVDIDMEKVADYVCKQAKKNNVGTFDPQDVFFIVQADLDYQEQNL